MLSHVISTFGRDLLLIIGIGPGGLQVAMNSASFFRKAPLKKAPLSQNDLLPHLTRQWTTQVLPMSIGLASMQRDSPVDADTLVEKSDSAMYKSKKISGHVITVSDD